MSTIPFEDIRALFGQPIDHSDVVAFLARYPDHKVTKPDDGSQYVTFKSLGFDLLFRQPGSLSEWRRGQPRVLICVFLYREGQEKHREFSEPPFGIAFTDPRDTLLAKLGQPYRSSDKDAEGLPWWEKWLVGDMTVHTMYDRETMTSKVFAISRAQDESDLAGNSA